MRFFPRFAKPKSRKSAFGGEVKSQKEVKALHERIKKVEERELQEFEKEFETQSKHLWK